MRFLGGSSRQKHPVVGNFLAAGLFEHLKKHEFDGHHNDKLTVQQKSTPSRGKVLAKLKSHPP